MNIVYIYRGYDMTRGTSVAATLSWAFTSSLICNSICRHRGSCCCFVARGHCFCCSIVLSKGWKPFMWDATRAVTSLWYELENSSEILFLESSFPGGGGVGYLTKFYTGRLCSEVQPLNPFMHHFGRKDTPFIYLLLKKGTPFTHLF